MDPGLDWAKNDGQGNVGINKGTDKWNYLVIGKNHLFESDVGVYGT